MSVLSFPRIYFNGYMEWDPMTANNNDYLPVYNAADAALDWTYLKGQNITRKNFRKDFRNWVVNAQTDTCPQVPNDSNPVLPTKDTSFTDSAAPPLHDWYHMASRWNYFGGGGSKFISFKPNNVSTSIVGGMLAKGQPADSGDPILGKSLDLSGNVFGGHPSPARLVDINAQCPWSSQVFFKGFQAGEEGASVGGPGSLRMHSRSFLAPRNISSDLIIAGAIGVIFQGTVPFDELTFDNSGNSALLASLKAAMDEPGAKGLMFRFSIFNTRYYQNGQFNDIEPQPQTASELSKLYQDGGTFKNLPYSRAVGSIGVWKDGELSTTPGGHELQANAKVSGEMVPGTEVTRGELIGMVGHAGPRFAKPDRKSLEAKADSNAGPPLPFGNIWGEFDLDQQLVSLDMSNGIPEFDLDTTTLDGPKFDYGAILVGLQVGSTFHEIGQMTPGQYNLDAYKTKGGIVDVDLTASTADVQNWLNQGGRLALQVGGTVASLENSLVADTDSRGIYIDEGEPTEFVAKVSYRNGAPLPSGASVKLKLAQYFPWPLKASSGSWALFGSSPSVDNKESGFCSEMPPSGRYVSFPDGDVIDVVNGEATIRLDYVNPGFPVVTFFPFLSTEEPPVPPDMVGFGFTEFGVPTIGTAPYTSIRCMPADNNLPELFVQRWNGTGRYQGKPKYNRELTWRFVYRRILYVYDMLFPVMDNFMPLGNLERIEGAADQLITMIQESWVDESTLYMPISRDLSAGKRLILETWCELIIRKYPQEDLPPLSVSQSTDT